jgi:nucleotide-binding universal stress UspA family protein
MYERIAVATDGSPRALDAVRTAGKLAALCGLTELHVIAAADPLTNYELESIRADLPEELHEAIDPFVTANTRIEQAQRELRPLGINAVAHETGGPAAEAILVVVESIDADLIVVGARGIGPLARFLRGSVSTKVAQHSPCDVLIVEHD